MLKPTLSYEVRDYEGHERAIGVLSFVRAWLDPFAIKSPRILCPTEFGFRVPLSKIGEHSPIARRRLDLALRFSDRELVECDQLWSVVCPELSIILFFFLFFYDLAKTEGDG